MNYKDYRYQIKYSEKTKWISNWFSNMLDAEIIIDGETYQSTESYYQSQKATNEKDRLYIGSLSGPKSKIEVQKIIHKIEWNDIKIDIMKKALKAKFSKRYWKILLMSTENDPIIEWNNWGDKFWGVTVHDNQGKNNLGKLLMDIREEFKYKSLFKNKK